MLISLKSGKTKGRDIRKREEGKIIHYVISLCRHNREGALYQFGRNDNFSEILYFDWQKKWSLIVTMVTVSKRQLVGANKL